MDQPSAVDICVCSVFSILFFHLLYVISTVSCFCSTMHVFVFHTMSFTVVPTQAHLDLFVHLGTGASLPEGLHHQGILWRGCWLLTVQRVRPRSRPEAHPIHHQNSSAYQTGAFGIKSAGCCGRHTWVQTRAQSTWTCQRAALKVQNNWSVHTRLLRHLLSKHFFFF